MIAAQLGVSTSTVSLALRKSPSISEPTRERVLRGAERLGYRPDPEISKLMSHLRVGWKPGFKSTIYALSTLPESEFSEYHADVLRGALQRAEQLGYGFTFKRFDPETVHRRVLQRMLVNQGIEGVMLLPMAASLDCDDLLDWSHFSVVAATYAVRSPQFHRVVPHQFANVRKACFELTSLGYQRLGLIQRRGFSSVVNHSFLAALTTENFLRPEHAVEPFLYSEDFPRGLKQWFAREKPDALVIDGEATYAIAIKAVGVGDGHGIGIALTNRERDSVLAGIDEHGMAVGRTAVDVLAFKIQTGEKGIPSEPAVTMIDGKWHTTPALQGKRTR